MMAEIRHRADRFRQDQQPVGVIGLFPFLRLAEQSFGDLNAYDHAGQVVVHHGRVAQVGDQHKGLPALTGYDHFTDF